MLYIYRSLHIYRNAEWNLKMGMLTLEKDALKSSNDKFISADTLSLILQNICELSYQCFQVPVIMT